MTDEDIVLLGRAVDIADRLGETELSRLLSEACRTAMDERRIQGESCQT